MSRYTEKILPVVRPYGRRLQHWIDNRLTDLTEQPELGRLDRTREKALAGARQLLLYELEGRSGAAQIWHGAAAGSGAPLTVAYLGDAQSFKVRSPDYLQHILFQEGSARIEERGALQMSAARTAFEDLTAHSGLVVAEVNDRLRWTPEGGVWRWMPTWVRMVMSLPPGEPWESVKKRMHGQRNNMTIARRGGFTFAISNSLEDFDYFYEHMYLPMMNGRHSEYGAVNRREELLPYLTSGMLMLAYHGSQAVAGTLAHTRGHSMFGMVNGILDGYQDWYDRGAISFLYMESIRWCHENGFTRYDFGGARPFEHDGLYRYKLRWGMQPMPDIWLGRSWLFWAPPGGPGEQWLREHPAVKADGVLESTGATGAADTMVIAGAETAEGTPVSTGFIAAAAEAPAGEVKATEPGFVPRALRPIRRAARRAQRSFEQRLIHLTADPRPGPARRVQVAAVSRARLLLLAGLEGSRGEAHLWQGAESASGTPLRVAFAGDERAIASHSAEYLRHILFRGEGQGAPGQPIDGAHQVNMLRLDPTALARGADLVVTERSRLLAGHPPSGGAWLTAPTWVRMGIVFTPGEPWEELEKRMAAHKNNIRRFQKAGFTFWTSTKEEDFHTFYDRMHLPMITGRHGDYTEVEPKESMLESFRKNGLLIFTATPDGQTVAGKLLYHFPQDRLAYVISAGTLDGDKRWHNLGALSALTWQEIRWGWEQGLRVLDCGSVRPFATDGNYLFKLRWGMKPIADPWAARSWLFWVPDPRTPGGTAALRWMQAHPLIPVPGAQSSMPSAAPVPQPAPQPAFRGSPVPVTGGEREEGDQAEG